MDDKPTAIQQIHDALLQRAFQRDWTDTGRLSYVGFLDSSDVNVPVKVEITDLDFIEPITIRLNPAADEKIPLLAHVTSGDLSICYFEPGGVVLDRYDPGGTVLQCLDQAAKVVRDSIRGRLTADFAEEFSAYWSDLWVMIDLPCDHVGATQERRLAIKSASPDTEVICNGDSWLWKLHRQNCNSGAYSESVEVVRISQPLAPIPGLPWPPETLDELNKWLSATDASSAGKLETAFSKSDGPAQWLMIAAPNGTCLARAHLPAAYKTKEFLTTRRGHLANVLKRIADKVKIERYNGFRADSAYIFGRNMGGRVNLSGKQILLVGCGTIGGFLAQQLVQSGAGADGGRLVVVDRDILKTANLGRHLLGVPYLNRNKAEACRDFLLQQLPLVRVEAHDADVLEFSKDFARFDLIIDATGEEAVSIAINDRAVMSRPETPPVLFVWLLGNGAAAQCILTGEPEFACFKCLKPNLSGPHRYRTLRDDVEIAVEKNYSCSDALYVPFPVSRSVSAAALACEQALDWANGSTAHRFRSHTLDSKLAYTVKDANPLKFKECPACGRSA